ncbi:MAG: hypothetical protein ACI4JY_03970 [Oscillospiraceae bacterium]
MKRIFCIFAALAVVLSMTGCQKEETTSSGEKFTSNEEVIVNGKLLSEYAVPVSEVSADYDKHFENCKSKEFINLDWTNTPKLEFPELTECRDIEVALEYPSPSNKEALAKFENQCKQVFGEDYDSSKFFFNTPSKKYPEVIESGNGMTFENAGSRVSDYREELENNDDIKLGWLTYVNLDKLHYLWGSADCDPVWVCKGHTIALTGIKYRPTGLLPCDLCGKYPTETFINDGTISDKTYRLDDGDYSIGEAIDYLVNDFYPTQPYGIYEGVTCKVNSVSAIQLEDDLYVYYMNFSPAYYGIPFDAIGEFSTTSSNSDRADFRSQAIISKKNYVDMAHRPAQPNVTEVGDVIDKIIPLDKAAEIASESLTQAVKFEVKTAELIYSGMTNRETYIDHLCPSWKFMLYNANDNLYYNVYVDAVSGECTYFSYSMI